MRAVKFTSEAQLPVADENFKMLQKLIGPRYLTIAKTWVPTMAVWGTVVKKKCFRSSEVVWAGVEIDLSECLCPPFNFKNN
ncbi:hypothetical protein COCON_G00087210 [Conger conger]|uniref:Uncharacterized protein n=1 Tax=Conger conger TaxID=82655 RepID=A0A9Q1DL56_CONCO|nr:hypothetical protein COCON_G00087210 [Conger conger]